MRYLNCCKNARCVIACRVSPAQKAQLVDLVRFGLPNHPITLGIGDGANDVNMIQSSHVGVGIIGKEGLQAVNNSDFAISQFRFLNHLLLVYGKDIYRRVCGVILYSFYKNIALVLTIFFFQFFTGQSGATFYDSILKVFLLLFYELNSYHIISSWQFLLLYLVQLILNVNQEHQLNILNYTNLEEKEKDYVFVNYYYGC